MTLATTMSTVMPVMPAGLHASGTVRSGGHQIMRCPRPSCGGQILVVDVALDEVAAICMLCARTVSLDGTETASGTGGVL